MGRVVPSVTAPCHRHFHWTLHPPVPAAAADTAAGQLLFSLPEPQRMQSDGNVSDDKDQDVANDDGAWLM